MQFFLILLILISSSHASRGQLEVGFYAAKCPTAESIVGGVVREAAVADENNLAVLLRLHFHDCFVHGCDGSILIDRGQENDEKRAFGHLGVRGFDIIEKAKAELERVCPGIVSCADIVAMAARDAVFLAKGPRYAAETGRRDGDVSDLRLAADMPDVGDSIEKLRDKFFAKGLDEKDLVVLSAAHTIGTTACFFMDHRLYRFPGSDPSIDPSFLPELKSTCPKDGNADVRIPMDRVTPRRFDRQILLNVRSGFAVLESDAALYRDGATRRIVDSYFGLFAASFEADFVASMIKMGRVGVITGSQGRIRRVCSRP